MKLLPYPIIPPIITPYYYLPYLKSQNFPPKFNFPYYPVHFIIPNIKIQNRPLRTSNKPSLNHKSISALTLNPFFFNVLMSFPLNKFSIKFNCLITFSTNTFNHTPIIPHKNILVNPLTNKIYVI